MGIRWPRTPQSMFKNFHIGAAWVLGARNKCAMICMSSPVPAARREDVRKRCSTRQVVTAKAIGGPWRVWGGVGGAGRCWQLLGGAGRCWEVLGGVGRCWEVLGGVGRCWQLLGGVGRCWLLLGDVEVTGRYWELLVVAFKVL